MIFQKRAQEIAALVAKDIASPDAFELVQAEKAYINAYFDAATYAERVVDSVLELNDEFGRGSQKGERLMVEYAQPKHASLLPHRPCEKYGARRIACEASRVRRL